MSPEEIEMFMNKSLNINFLQIKLSNKLEEFVGKGYVFQDNNGVLKLRVFTDKKEKNPMLVIKENLVKTPPGSLIKDSEFYDLHAEDFRGRKWEAKRILPQKEIGIKGDIFVSAQLHEISCKKEAMGFSGPAVIKYIYSKKFPFNTYIEREEKIQDRNLRSFDLSAATFNFERYSVLITRENDYLNVNVYPEKETLPEYIEARMNETLWFILSERIDWIYFKNYVDGYEVTYLRSFPTDERPSNFYAPLAKSDVDFDKSVKKLFECYQNFIISSSEKDKYHSISQYVSSLIRAGQGSLEALCLTLGVSVEGLLKSEFGDIEIESDVLEQEIKEFEEWIYEKDHRESFVARLEKCKEGFQTIRAVDRLYELNKRDLIEENLIKSWKKLRNAFAHAGGIKKSEIGKYLNHVNNVSVLFYKLIFLRIGYTGPFLDYSQREWKRGKFEKVYSKI